MTTLSPQQIFRLWSSLAVTNLMMAVQGPFLTAMVARMDAPIENLAAFGSAWTFALIIEAPVMMLMPVSTALVRNAQSYYLLRRFALNLCVFVSVAMGIFLVPAVHDFIVADLIGLPPRVAELVYGAMWILFPWPAAIGYRRLYQGIIVRHSKARLVAVGTAVRMISMVAAALLVSRLVEGVPGAFVGAAGLSFSVCAEALAVRIMARSGIRRAISQEWPGGGDTKPLTVGEVWHLAYPLMLTAVMGLVIYPVSQFFVARSRMGIESLAVMPVVQGLFFLFTSAGLAYQDVVIALIGDKWQHYKELRRFTVLLALGLFALPVAITFSPLILLWYDKVSGLNAELLRFSLIPSEIHCFRPVLTALVIWQHSLLIAAKRTKVIPITTMVEVVFIACGLWLLIGGLDTVGALAQSIATVGGSCVANLLLSRTTLRTVAARVRESSDGRH